MEPDFVSGEFAQEVFLEYLINGRLRSAMAYLAQFPPQKALYDRYVSRFRDGNDLIRSADAELNEILLIYQKYYREAFYLEHPKEDAAEALRGRFAACFQLPDSVPLDEIEEKQVPDAFRAKGLHILTGRTSGWYGPYIWRREELRRYAVELPDGAQEYTVKLLDDFVMAGWLDYLSFGAAGTGGWSSSGGLIHCVKSSYDLESESFRVSLLKHEAQHAQDLTRYKGMTSGDLEYRAKLVELIYSRERNLLVRFAGEADGSHSSNGHGLAAERIVKEFGGAAGRFRSLSIEEIQAIARKLFAASTEEAAKKYI